MNYRDQENFLQGSRIWGGAVAGLFLLMSVLLRLSASGRWPSLQTLVFFLIAIAIAILIYYTPDYLHLSVSPGKKRRWEISFRWRIAAAIALLGLILASSNGGRIFALLAGMVMAGANWFALKQLSPNKLGAYFWTIDVVLLFLSLVRADAGTASMVLLLLAAAAHVAIVRREDRYVQWAVIVAVSGMIVVAFATGPFGSKALVAGAGLLLTPVAGTYWLVHRARKQNAKNIDAAMAELTAFTNYQPDRIRELWATSNQQLAANWQHARPAKDNPEQMAEWYRQNSELYLFAISAYNLEYKRIRSNMKVLRMARGATLDYGAGNGEILLELARRGQRAAYYDVEGVTMRFARERAALQGLSIDFFHSKDALAQYACEHGFDTVFSFDVLEHLPDLPGELNFLSSLLNPGGLFVFDVPAGSTRAHPMHLNHHLNVLQFMAAKGMTDERPVTLRLPFRKEEKFVFRAPAQPENPVPAAQTTAS